tara:strand:- start:345 stop:1115 length:771 start_codon:yes stop_codon:yes gene_type:complete
VIKYLIKIPLLKNLISSVGIRLMKYFNLNRRYFKINGINMFLDFLDPIDRIIILNKSYEQEEINILTKLIKKNSITKFIDVGSNCGFYSFNFASKNMEVFSFEPNSEANLKMNKTIIKNKILQNKIKHYSFGISNINSKMKMKSLIKHGYVQTGGSTIFTGNKQSNYKLKVYEADFKIGDEVLNFKNERLSFKIDVEGHELEVLQGISNLLDFNKIVLQVEIFENNFNKVNLYLNKKGYNLIDSVKKRSNYFYSNN